MNNTNITLTPQQRTAIRRYVGISDNFPPINIVEGYDAPKSLGESFFHTTPSGKTIVNYPNAYGYRTLYHPSTRRVTVGAGWLTAYGLA